MKTGPSSSRLGGTARVLERHRALVSVLICFNESRSEIWVLGRNAPIHADLVSDRTRLRKCAFCSAGPGILPRIYGQQVAPGGFPCSSSCISSFSFSKSPNTYARSSTSAFERMLGPVGCRQGACERRQREDFGASPLRAATESGHSVFDDVRPGLPQGLMAPRTNPPWLGALPPTLKVLRHDITFMKQNSASNRK